MFEEICGLFRIAGLSHKEVKKKILCLSLEGHALKQYRYLDSQYYMNWDDLSLNFYKQFYILHQVQMDRNYI